MATVSSAGGGSSMGNAQVGTRGLSAGDWIRLQRLRGARANGYSNASTNGVLTRDLLFSTRMLFLLNLTSLRFTTIALS